MEEASLVTDEDDHNIEVERIESLVEKYQKQSDGYTAELDDIKILWMNIDQELEFLDKELKDNVKNRDKIQADLDNATEVWTQETQDFEEAIELLTKANDELKSAHGRSVSGEPVLIQNNNHKQRLDNLKDELEYALNKVSAKTPVFV